jgi:hypothetical protein
MTRLAGVAMPVLALTACAPMGRGPGMHHARTSSSIRSRIR